MTQKTVTATQLDLVNIISAIETSLSIPAIGSVTSVGVSSTDLTVSGTPITTSGTITININANAVTNTKLAQMAAGTLKGNNTGSTSNASDLTVTQVTAMLNQFSSSLQGLVSGSGGGTHNFLRADNSWTTPADATAGTGGVQFYSSGAFLSDVNFTYNPSGIQLQLGSASTPGVILNNGAGGSISLKGGVAGAGAGGSVTVLGGTGATTGAGGTATLQGGPGGSTSGNGGSVTITGGVPTVGNGGAVSISGAAGVGTTQNGGPVSISGGTGVGSGSGGSISITAGTSPSGTLGNISFSTNTTTRLSIDGGGAWTVGGGVGSSTQVLTSNGTGASPSWQSVVSSLTAGTSIGVSGSTGSITVNFTTSAQNTSATTYYPIFGSANTSTNQTASTAIGLTFQPSTTKLSLISATADPSVVYSSNSGSGGPTTFTTTYKNSAFQYQWINNAGHVVMSLNDGETGFPPTNLQITDGATPGQGQLNLGSSGATIDYAVNNTTALTIYGNKAIYLNTASGVYAFGTYNKFISYLFSTVAATGTTQGTAAALVSTNNVVTASVNNTGVILQNFTTPSPPPMVVRVINSSIVRAIQVYPPSSGTIDGGSANAAITIPAGGVWYGYTSGGTDTLTWKTITQEYTSGTSTTSNQVLLSNGSGLPTWTNTPTLTGTNFSGIPNGALSNSSVTVTAGTGMSGGGAVSLGGTITLTNAGVTSITGTANQVTASASTGGVTLSLPQSIATSSSPTFAQVTLGNSSSTIGAAVHTFGSTVISGTTGGYAGIQFTGAFGTQGRTLMVSSSANVQGFYDTNASAWDWYFQSGVLTQGTVPAASINAGTAGINISGNAATATTATNQSGGTVAATTATVSSYFESTSGSAGAGLFLNSSGANYGNVVTNGTQIWQLGYANTLGGAGTAALTWQSSGVEVLVSLGVGTAASGTTGEIRATNNITAFYSSDATLKINVAPIPNALLKVEQIAGVEFDWSDEFIEKSGGEDGYFVRRHDVGVIAQDVEKVLPEVVATRPDGIKAVKYDRMVALLIEAVKELSAENKKLIVRLVNLEKRASGDK